LEARSLAAQPESRAQWHCEQRFKSYDPASGTYLGYDGERRACRSPLEDTSTPRLAGGRYF